MKRFTQRFTAFALCVLMALPFAANISFASDVPKAGVNEVIEAENGLLAGGAVKISDSMASGGAAVKFTALSGEPGNWGNAQESWDSELSFNFYSETGGSYDLMIKCMAPNGGSDSFFYKIGSGAWAMAEPANTSSYEWMKLKTVSLSAGDNIISFHRREAGFSIDAVKMTNEVSFDDITPLAWAEPAYKSGNVYYPRLLDSSSIGSVTKFEPNDRVAFIGDSITHGGYHHSLIFNYYSTRYPDAKFSYVNKGIGGDVVNEIISRLNHDVFDAEEKPFNKAVVMIGTNDMSRGSYFEGKELEEGAESSRKALLDKYETALTNLAQQLKTKGLEQVVFLSSPLFDQWLPDALTNKPTSVDFNNVIRKAGSIAYDVSQSAGFEFVDINTPQTIVQYYNMEKQGEGFTFVPDRVHPNEVGHYIMTYAFLRAQGESGEVASVAIDVAAQKADTSNAAVSELSASSNAVAYKYKANALPLGADSTYRAVEKLLPITDELNRETIKVSGLNDGVYDIKMDGTVVMQATAAQLAEGVNIADKKNNPAQQQSLKLLAITKQRRALEAGLRDFVGREIDYISKYKLNPTSKDTLISSAQSWIAANPSSTSDIALLNTYISDKNSEQTILANLEKYEQAVYDRNKTSQRLVVIEPSTATEALQAKSVYFDYELPENTLMIKPRSAARNVSLERITFSDANGEIATMPSAGTKITAAATLKNNTDRDIDAVLWVGTYNGNKLVSVSTQKASVGAGASVPVSTEVTVGNGADSINAGVWEDFASMKPYVPSAVFPPAESGIKAVYVNGVKFNAFDETKTEYVCYINKLDARIPYVNVTGKNTNANISVTQAPAIGGSAVITTPSAEYRIRFENEPLPVLSSIAVDGTAVENFSPARYSYVVSLEGEGASTISATAPEGIDVEITQPTETNKTATIVTTSPFGYKRTYTVNISKIAIGTPGTLSNIKWKGSDAGTKVKTVPSLGATKPANYYDDTKTAQEMLAAAAADNVFLDGNSYEFYSNRPLNNMWTTNVNNYFGYNTQFMYAEKDGSILMDKLVTRFVKPDRDCPAGYTGDLSKIFEFDIDKGATVYITTSGEGSYIKTRSDWTHEYNVAKYALLSPSYEDKAYDDNGKTYYARIPTGSTVTAEVARGHVYYKHYEAGSHVEIPSYNDATADSYRNSAIFIVWDECNRESEIYNIYADGTAIENFDKNTLSYTLRVADGSAVPTISVSATAGAETEITQAASLSDSATVTACGKTYTISFVTVSKEPGTISNVKYKGKATTAVYGVPSIGIDPPDLYTGKTNDERVAAVKALAGSQYDTNAYAVGSNRGLSGGFGKTINGYYGYNGRFTYAHTANIGKTLYGANVTRLYKNDNDAPTAATAEKIYEFTVDKPATIYISTSSSRTAQNTVEARSAYIEGLNKGWKYEYNVSKYFMNVWNCEYATASNGDKAAVPNGRTAGDWLSSGSVYYKHFNAGENVEIPAFSETDSDIRMSVFAVWDNCNDEAKIFGITADGKEIAGFDENTLTYTVNIEEGASVPVIDAVATAGANASVVQAASLSDSATVTACGKTYTIKFNVIAPNMELSSLTVDGELIDGFEASKKDYIYTVERGVMTMPKINAVPSLSTRTAEVTYPVKMPGTAKITVKSDSGASKVYTVNIVKTGTPGAVSNIYAGGAATTAVTAVPSLGIDPVDMYNAFETDEERIAAIKAHDSSVNPYYYTDARYAQYTDRWPGTAWDNKNSNVYGGNVEFTYMNHKDSIFISPDVTRLYKSTSDPSGTEDKAAKSYEFNISKDATVYITTGAASDFIASQGWTYANDSKYRVYYPSFKTASDGTYSYTIPTGGVNAMGNANGIVYYKHFTKNERVSVPAFAINESYRKMNVFIVWDDCNDERNIYGMYYTDGETVNKINFDKDTKTYNITLPTGTTKVPAVEMSATKPVGAQVNAPSEFTNGKAVVTVRAEAEKGIVSTYTINFFVDVAAADDTRLKSVSENGTAVEDFDMYMREYYKELAYGTEYPTLAAEANSASSSVSVVNPSDENNGVGTITVTAQGGASAVYTFTYKKLDYVPASASIMPIKNGFKSIVTIVHDDGDISVTMPYLSKEMERNNLKTTVALIGSNVLNNDGSIKTSAAASWQKYFDTGRFNLANHSWHHTYWGQSDEAETGTTSDGKSFDLPKNFMTQEITVSGEKLREAFPNERVLAFVKPGFTFPTGKPQVSEYATEKMKESYICMRNTGGASPNTIPPANWFNMASLMVNANDDYTDKNNHTAAYWIDEVDRTIANNGWLVFLFHNIRPDGQEGGLTVAQSRATMLFEALGDRAANGDVWCAYLDEAAMYVKEAQTAKAVAKDYTNSEGKITISVTDGVSMLDGNGKEIYNYPVTVKVQVPDGWTYAKTVQDGRVEVTKTFAENGKTYAYANVVPDIAEAALTQADSAVYVESISVDGTAIDGFDSAKYDYEITLPAGTTEAPVVTAQYAGGECSITQAALDEDGFGSAKVSIEADGQNFVYTVRFKTDKTGTGPVVLLKFDDMREGAQVRGAIKRAAAYVKSKGGHANIGVIAVSLEDNGTKDSYYSDIKQLIADGHEIWNHGYYHNASAAAAAGYSAEFYGGTYDEQKAQLDNANKLLLEKCGYTATTFGAPGNQTDDTTKQVLAATPQIKATYFGPGGVEGVTDLSNSMVFEQSGTVDGTWKTWLVYKSFVAAYEEAAAKNPDYIVMQSHPLMWGSDENSIHFKIFKDQIDYMLSRGARFMTANEYLETIK